MPSRTPSGTRARRVAAARQASALDEETLGTPEVDQASGSYALRLTEALDAITAAQAALPAQGLATTPPARGRNARATRAASSYAAVLSEAVAPEAQAAPARQATRARAARVRLAADGPSTSRRGLRQVAAAATDFDQPATAARGETPDQAAEPSDPSTHELSAPLAASDQRRGVAAWLTALDRLPPIRLPLGPAIPWRLGLPALAMLIVLVALVSRSTPRGDSQGVRLPAAETYAVQQEAPLFQKPDAQTASAPVGVAEPAAGADFVDIGLKLAAVVAVAYGSLMLLKRAGVGGAGPTRLTGGAPNVRVVASLALAPNRSVHVLQAPGGKTLLLGATPTQVNLLADLGQVDLDATAADPSFLDVLTSKIAR